MSLRAVLRLIGIAVLALILSGLAVMLIPVSILYPDWCAPGTSVVGQPPGAVFCIRYDPAIGRYEDPPPDVPADVSARALEAAHPDLVRRSHAIFVFATTLAVSGAVARGSARQKALQRVTFRDAD
jgi:hypothetical protein